MNTKVPQSPTGQQGPLRRLAGRRARRTVALALAQASHPSVRPLAADMERLFVASGGVR